MFLKCTRGYTRTGEQRAAGSFLMLFSTCESKKVACSLRNAAGYTQLRALVRYVRLRQMGHYMMGSIIVRSSHAKASLDTVPVHQRSDCYYRVGEGHYKISVSGSYGNDGMPLAAELFPGLWEQLHPLPDELVEEYWHGDGLNSAGKEGPAMHKWGLQNINTLRKLHTE